MTVPDKLAVGNHIFSDHDPHPPISWSITDIFAQSSNIRTILTAQKLGRERIDHYMRAFGYGSAGSASPARPPAWSSTPRTTGSPPWVRSPSAPQRGGDRPADAPGVRDRRQRRGLEGPELVMATVNDKVAPEYRSRRHPAGRPARQPPSGIDAMLRTVVSGHGRNAAVTGYTVGGKTGTARKPKVGGLGYEGYVASFASFCPPRIPPGRHRRHRRAQGPDDLRRGGGGAVLSRS